MFKKFFVMSSAVLALLGAGNKIVSGAEIPDMVPMPKEYKQTGGTFSLEDKTIWIDEKNRQCQIAAKEIADKIKELGGKSGEIKNVSDISQAGIYILSLETPQALSLVKELSLSVTKSEPGPQGYAIKTLPEKLIIIGSDSIGTLYGAMTLRQMMQSKNKEVSIENAYVYDKPDYRYRANNSLIRGLSKWENGEKNRSEAYKAGIDWMMRFKLNIICDYSFKKLNPRDVAPEEKNFVKEINAYAVERGIYPSNMESTEVANTYSNPEIKINEWPCVKDTRSRTEMHFYCWSRDDLAEKRANEVIDFYKECNFRMLLLHPVDGGGIEDPELWSRRCPECRKRFGDGERWKATVHQTNLWTGIIKEKIPGTIIISPFYPYAAEYGIYERFKKDVDKETWYRNTIDYWTKVNKELDRSVLPMTWNAPRSLMDKYREYWKGRPISIFGNAANEIGFFSTMYRNVKTSYYGNPNDVYWLSGNVDIFGRWMCVILCNEFCWNTNAPGHEDYNGLIYDVEKDHTGPNEIINDWLPRACRAFYGNEIGKHMAKVYQAGILDYYIMDPGAGLARANKPRRHPLADVDPLEDKTKKKDKSVAQDVIDSPERMEFQVNATKKALDAVLEAYPSIDTLDKYRKKTFLYYYRRVPLWHMIAKARHAIYIAAEFQKKGEYAKASDILEKSLKDYEKDYQLVLDILKKTAKTPDTMPYSPTDQKGDVKPKPEELKKMLISRLEDSKIVLKPRHPGPVVKVAVYKGIGEKSVLQYLETFKNLKADLIENLNLSTLDKYDCIIILQTNSIDRFDYFESLPRYIAEGGGGVIFQHDLCGFGRNPFGNATSFPEIVKMGKERCEGREIIAAAEHPALGGLKKGEKSKLMYLDYIVPEPGASGQIIAKDNKDNPVVVVGQPGYGKVLFYGGISIGGANDTYVCEERMLENFDALLVKGAIEWITGVKLEKK